MTGLAGDIVATVAYADVMDFPLTGFEIWKYLMATGDDTDSRGPVNLDAVLAALQTEEVKKRLVSDRGWFALRGRSELFEQRWIRERRSEIRMKRIRGLGRVLRFVPFVRMVALTGSVAMKNAKRGSDWDMLIVLRAGHIWMGRIVVSGVLHLIGRRRWGRHTRDRACLNFWITSESLEIPLKDWFSSWEYSTLIPLFGAREFRRFRMENRWIARFRPQYQPTTLVSRWCVGETWLSRIVRDIGEVILGDAWLERKIGEWQRRKIAANPKTQWPGSLIVADDRTLIFLPKPRGPKIFEKFKRRVSEIEAIV
jgi:hypothetical protein